MHDYLYFLWVFASLMLVLALIGGVAYLERRFSGRLLTLNKQQHRIAIVERTVIDPKRRLVLIRRDDIEHLLLIGGTQDLVVETGITRHMAAPLPEPTPPVAPRSRLDEVRF